MHTCRSLACCAATLRRTRIAEVIWLASACHPVSPRSHDAAAPDESPGLSSNGYKGEAVIRALAPVPILDLVTRFTRPSSQRLASSHHPSTSVSSTKTKIGIMGTVMGPKYKLTQADIAVNYYLVLGVGARWGNDDSESRGWPSQRTRTLRTPLADLQSRSTSSHTTRHTAVSSLRVTTSARSGICVAVSNLLSSALHDVYPVMQ